MAIRFNDDWLNDPTLTDWLVRVSNDEARAYCRFCAIVLRAHKSDLTSHATTGKHIKNVATSSNAPTGPISVQIIVDDNQPTTPISGLIPTLQHDKTPGSSGGSGGGGMGSMGMGSMGMGMGNMGMGSMGGLSGIRSVTPRIQYPKKYRVEWEEIEEFRDWLTPDPHDSSRARCKICSVHLRAHKHDLLLHGKSSKHKKCCEDYADGNFITVQFGDSIHGEMGEEGECMDTQDHDGLRLKKMNEEGEDGHHEDIDGEVGEEVICPDIKQEILDGKKEMNIIRVAAPTSRAGTGMRYGKRRRFNVNDVIESIHQNHFTGYELLQICKAAIPKL